MITDEMIENKYLDVVARAAERQLNGLDPIDEINDEVIFEYVDGDMQLNGFFKKLKRKVKKVVKKTKKAVKKVTKKVINVHKKVGKKILKAHKKAAPLAVAGAAIYFGGPAAVGALKAGGGALVAGAKKLGISDLAKKLLAKKIAGKMSGPEGQEISSMSPIDALQNPNITDAALPILKSLLAKTGLKMESQEANDLMRMMLQQYQEKFAAKLPASFAMPPTPQTPLPSPVPVPQRTIQLPYKPVKSVIPQVKESGGIDTKTALAVGVPVLTLLATMIR